ncbi:MAG: NDP-sugar synthase [Verrucomicrobiae bacterium]|nr:NDP-sugar synthase [Verrucomicrobiae bacterium]MDW8343132.1 NDP-sugar synthase [Verrucomicrobiae bacterium]
MKVFILAAGLGTRLRSLGLDVPKVMVPIGGKPLLEHHVELLRAQGVTEFIINLHYRPEKITGYFGDGSRWGVRITYSHEPELLGTAGGVKKMEAQLREGTFVVLYGDNLVRFELGPLVAFHRQHRAEATVTLMRSAEPWTGGVVEFDASGRVVRFVEKPPRESVTSDWINAGVLVLEPAVLNTIPAGQFSDFGKDILPAMVASGRAVFATPLRGYVQDVGTPERLAKARADFERGLPVTVEGETR